MFEITRTKSALPALNVGQPASQSCLCCTDLGVV